MSKINRPSGINPNDPNAVVRLAEMLRVWNGEGRDPKERVITEKDLREMLNDSGSSLSLGQAFDRRIGDEPPSRAVPSRPTGVEARGHFSFVMVRWDPVRGEGYSYSEVWRNTENDRAAAVQIGQGGGYNFVDEEDEPGTYYYWVRHVNQWGGVGPWHDIDGASAEVKPRPEELLEELTGRITESQLYKTLNERIDLIDGPETMPGSVTARIRDEMDVLRAEVGDLLDAPEWAPGKPYSEGAVVVYDEVLYRAVQDVPEDTPPPDETYWEEVGAYRSIGESVTALSTRISEVENDVYHDEDGLTATAQRLDDLDTIVRDEDEGLFSRAFHTDVVRLETDIKDGAGVASFEELGARFVSLEEGLESSVSKNEFSELIAEENLAKATEVSQIVAKLEDPDTEGQYAAIEQKADVEVVQGLEEDMEQVRASWTLRLEAGTEDNPVVGGIGLTVGGEDEISQFQINVDQFAVYHPDMEDGGVIPFTVEDGSVYMDDVQARNIHVTTAVVEDGFFDDLLARRGGFQMADVNVGNIWDLNIGGMIRSDDFDPAAWPDTTGFQIQRNGHMFIAGEGRGGMTITNVGISVYDENNNLRVRIGRL